MTDTIEALMLRSSMALHSSNDGRDFVQAQNIHQEDDDDDDDIPRVELLRA
jgi:hypothetical protein